MPDGLSYPTPGVIYLATAAASDWGSYAAWAAATVALCALAWGAYRGLAARDRQRLEQVEDTLEEMNKRLDQVELEGVTDELLAFVALWRPRAERAARLYTEIIELAVVVPAADAVLALEKPKTRRESDRYQQRLGNTVSELRQVTSAAHEAVHRRRNR